VTRGTHIGAVRTLYVPVQHQSVTRRRCIITQTSRRACRRGHDSLTAPAATSRSSSSYYYCCCPSYPVSSTRLPQNLRKTSLCSATTYADNVALPAFARRCCSNRSISPARRAHSSKPATHFRLWADAGARYPWGRQTDTVPFHIPCFAYCAGIVSK